MNARRSPADARVLVVGAGLSGLVAARSLAEAGHAVTVLDKGRSVGGRLATRRIGDAVLDHGAQFFTARSAALRREVEDWIEAGVVSEWCRGFDGDDGYPRYRCEGGMNRLAKHLAAQASAAGATMQTGVKATAIARHADRWGVPVEGSADIGESAAVCIVTAPVPQTLALLDAGGVKLDQRIDAGLRALRYHCVIALLVTLDQPVRLSATGARQQPEDPVFSFVADNQAKGISPSPAVTFHTAHELSAQLWDKTDDEVAAALLPPAQDLLDEAASATDALPIKTVQVKRWLYAGPVEPWPDRCVVAARGEGPLVLAGDAFGGPKVEGAFLSGQAAAQAVLGDS